MMLRRGILAVVLLICSSVALADVIQSLRAVSTGDGIVVSWTSGDQTGVTGYLIQRKLATQGDQAFIIVGSKPVQADANYSFTDNTAFRTGSTTANFYQYKVTAVNRAGQPVGSPAYAGTSSDQTSVRRTWGSIKAMFR